VFGMNWLRTTERVLLASLMTMVLVLSLVSCGDRAATQTVSYGVGSSQPSGNISEVSPPEVIQQLRQTLEVYQPQVKILSPQPDEVLQDNMVKVRFQVRDLPIFKNQELKLGPHLNVILDNQPSIAIYDLNQPLVLPDLPPGTHTLRVLASRPWDESFKNEGAYAQTTFHIFTKTQDNNPDPVQPLLTYSLPTGSYGAEPILLDFYLTNAPLHLVAQENPNDEVADWRIRCTINGNSFVLESWQSLYLKGFKPGKNWVELEFLDEKGNTVKNVFNNTVRLITYEPKGKDTLSKLVRGEISVAEARGTVEEKTSGKLGEDKQANPELETKQPTETETKQYDSMPEKSISPPLPLEKQKPGGFFNRFRRPPTQSSPSLPPTLPEIIESPAPESFAPQPELTPEPKPLITPQEGTSLEEEPTPSGEPETKQPDSMPEKSISPPLPSEKQKPGGFFNRFRRPPTQSSPSLPPTLPEIIESPTPKPIAPDSTPPQLNLQPLVTPREETSPSPSPELTNSIEDFTK